MKMVGHDDIFIDSDRIICAIDTTNILIQNLATSRQLNQRRGEVTSPYDGG